MTAAIAAFTLIAIVGAVIAIFASPPGPARLALATRFFLPNTALAPRFALPNGPPAWRFVLPNVNGPLTPGVRLPRLRIVQPPPVASALVFAVPENGSGRDLNLRTIGLVLLLVGIAGLIVSMLYWSPWASTSHWSRRHTYTNQDAGGAGY